jgi:thioredoxin 1
MASANVKTATDTNFDAEVMKSPKLAVVDFWAEWCGPCKMLGPTIDALADEYQGRAHIFKMNVDENPMTPGKFGVRGIPTLIFIKNGQLVDQLVGNQPKGNIAEAIQRHL